VRMCTHIKKAGEPAIVQLQPITTNTNTRVILSSVKQFRLSNPPRRNYLQGYFSARPRSEHNLIYCKLNSAHIYFLRCFGFSAYRFSE